MAGIDQGLVAFFRTEPPESLLRNMFLWLFLAGCCIRAIGLWQPVIYKEWHEFDTASIARNFVREGMDILHPRIDWRGDGPGFAEMEFPIHPWLTAVFYKVAGIREVIGRILMFSFSASTLVVFFLLARYLLPPWGALFASTFFTLSPLHVRLSTALQPEGLMSLFYLLAVYNFLRWIDEDSRYRYWSALAATALAILVKAPAAHIGILFAFLVLQKKGWGALKSRSVWAFAVLSTLPAILWYLHAHKLWLIYGNSLGVSNESHWVGIDFFTNSYFIRGLLKIELKSVWTPFGIVIGLLGMIYGIGNRKQTTQHLAFWILSIYTYYFFTSRTTADNWAAHYHIVSVPPVAMFFGLGVNASISKYSDRKSFIFLFAALVCFTFIYQARGIIGHYKAAFTESKMFRCAEQIKPLIPSDVLILASGGIGFDETGYPVAFNDPDMFYWLDRKGFNISEEEQSIPAIEKIAERGARYFIAKRDSLEKKPELESELRKRYSVVHECSEILLIKL